MQLKLKHSRDNLHECFGVSRELAEILLLEVHSIVSLLQDKEIIMSKIIEGITNKYKDILDDTQFCYLFILIGQYINIIKKK